MRVTFAYWWLRWQQHLRAWRRRRKLHDLAVVRRRSRFQTLSVEGLEQRQVLSATFGAESFGERSIDQGSQAVYSFRIVDSAVPPEALTVVATSDNGALLPDGALELSHLGDDRWLLFATPTAGLSGVANIEVGILGDGAPSTRSFALHVHDGSGYSSVSSEWFGAFSSIIGSSGGLSVEGDAASNGNGTGGDSSADDVSEWIVRLTNDALAALPTLEAAAAYFTVPDIGLTVVAGLGLPGQMLVRATGATAEVQDYFSSNTLLRYFERNVTVSHQATPNDPSFSSLYGLHNTGQTGGTADADIDAPEAWDLTTGSRSIVVGVIDTGIDHTHPDLAANIWTNPGEVAGNGIDDDLNGFIDDVHGYDFVNNDGNPMDDHYHGTHVAGTIGAAGNNGTGVVGVNWQTSMMGLKFLDSTGRGSTANAIRAVNYATMMRTTYGVNIRLTNNSWGGGGFDSGLLDAINAGGAADILFIAAAGNDGLNLDVTTHYPASYNSPYIVSVAATDHSDALASFSNYGATQVDLAAPGVSTYSTFPGNTYQSLSGTSMATPHVAGVAALALSLNPSLSATELKAALLDNVDAVAGLAGKTLTGGRLNALKVLEALDLSVAATSPAAGTILTTRPTSFTVDFTADLDAATVGAGDFLVNGIAADAAALNDADTVTFTFNTTPVTTPGVQTMTMAAGAVIRQSDGNPLEAFGATFRYDDLVLAPTATTPTNGSIVPTPLVSLDVQWNEAFDPASLAVGDLAVSQGSVTAVSAVDATTARFTFSGVVTEGTFTFSLAAGALTDAYGNPSAAFTGSYTVDIGTVPLPTPLTPVGMPGGMIYQTTAGATLAGGDVDSFTLTVEAGQLIGAVLRPAAPGLKGKIELRDTSGAVVATATAAAAGQNVLLPAVAASAAGTYTFSVSGADGTSGAFTLTAELNTLEETERFGGATNDSLATAQSLDGAFVAVGSGVSRAAVTGTSVSGNVVIGSQNFEAGFPSAGWSTYSSSVNGRIQLNNTYGVHGGSYALYMDTTSGSVLNEAIWTVDLSGRTQATLNFWQSEQGDEETALPTSFTGHYNADGVAISADGVSWYRLWNVVNQTTGAWAQYTFDLAAAAAAAGITFTSNFQIKFQQYDDNPFSTDGRIWDDITITVPTPIDGDWYSFSSAAGEAVSLAAQHTTGVAVELKLYDAAGRLISQGLPQGSADGVVMRYVAPTEGTNYVAVSATQTSDYALVVTKNALVDVDGNHSIASAQTLGAGQNVVGYIDDATVSSGTPISGSIDITGSPLSLGIASDGSFVGPTVGAKWNGVEFLRHGTYLAGFTVAAEGSLYTNSVAGGYGTSFSVTKTNADGGNVHTVTISGTPRTGLLFERIITWKDGDNYALVKSKLTNTSATAITGVALLDNQDPDPAGTTSTANDVVGKLVVASAASGAMGLGAVDPRAVVSAESFFVGNPFDVINSPGDPNGASSDIAINLAVNIGTLAAGTSTTTSLAMIFGGNQAAVEATYAALNFSGGIGAGDYYAVAAAAGDMLQFSTSTPGDAAGEFTNALDPRLDLFDATGTLLASDANGHADGRNAVLNHTVATAGTYYVRVSSTSSADPTAQIGEYLLRYSGGTVTSIPTTVATTTPSLGGKYTDLLSSLAVKFSEAVDFTSISASDLTINGVVATGVTFSGNDTAVFTFAEPTRGTVSFDIAAGAIVDLQQTPVAAFSGQVNYQLNTAPVLTTTPAPVLASVLEDDTVQAGMLISELLATGAGGDPIADADAGDGQGIAVVAADTSKGTWEYSLNNGSNWTPLGSVSTTSARLLAADALTRIRLKPSANQSGTIAAALTFRAWDQSLGVNGATAAVGAGGGTTPFSTAAATASLTIAAVNDAPSFTKGANQNVAANGVARSVSFWASGISQGPSETGQTLTFLVSNDNNGLFAVQPTISSAGTLTYTPLLNASGTATVSVQLQDSGGTADGGVDTSAVQTFTISMTPPPIITPITNQTISEDGITAALLFSVTDADTPASSLTVSTSTSNSTLTPTVGRVLTNLGDGNYQLIITPAANQSGTATITISASDGTWTTQSTFTLTVTAVNDAPTFTKGADVVATFPGAYSVANWATGISAGLNESQTLTFQLSVSDPSLFVVGPAISSAGSLTFTPVAGASGTAVVTVQLKDNGGTADGGVDTSAPQTFNIQVNTPTAAPGMLDATFGVAGYRTVDFGAGTAQAGGMAAQSDGKLIVAGFSNNGTSHASFTRLNVDGTVDTTFGTGGTAVVQVTASTRSWINYVAVQSDGKIVAVGGAGSTVSCLVIRLNADGSRDTTFGTNGVFQHAVGSNSELYDVEVLADGKLLAFGRTYSTGGMVVRYTAAGALDTSFGSGGIVYASYSYYTVYGYTGAVQPDGKILLAGSNVFDDYMLFFRYNADGTVDTSFNGAGVAAVSIGYGARAQDLVVQADGKIVAVGFSDDYSGYTNVALVRLNADGSRDSAFGASGVANLSFWPASDAGRTLVRTSDGKYFVGGYLNDSVSKGALLRVNADGSLDAGFGAGGYVTTGFNSGAEGIQRILLAPDGNLWAAGYTTNGTSSDFVVAKYLIAGSPATAPTITAVPPQSVSEDGTLTIDFTITDPDGPSSALVVDVLIADTTLIPTSDVTITDLGGDLRRATIRPAADRNGATSVTLNVKDPSGFQASTTFTVAVTSVNDAPSFTKGADKSQSTGDAQSFVGWATNITAGTNEAGQTVDFLVTVDNAAIFSALPTITPSGTLSYVTSGVLGRAVVSVRLHDDGGTADGGVDASPVQTFVIETALPPRVVSSSIGKDDVVGGLTTYTAIFSGAMNVIAIDPSDVRLHGSFQGLDYAPTSLGFDASGTAMTLAFASLPDDVYTLTLLSGDAKFESDTGRDLDGEVPVWPLPAGGSGDGADGGDFAVDFHVDAPAHAATSFTARSLLGGATYEAAPIVVAPTHAGDFDDVTVALDAGQTLSALIASSSGLQTTVALYGPTGDSLGSYAAASVGANLMIQSLPIATAGIYTLRIGGAAGTLGAAEVALTLNAALELEQALNAANSNNTPATAQNIDGAFVSLSGGAAQAGVVGVAGSVLPPAVDFESGVLGPAWSTYSSLTGGRVQLTGTPAPHGGSYALYMDTGAGSNTLNEAIWTVDLADLTQATLSFWHDDRSDEETALPLSFVGHSDGDGVSISADGNTWYRLWNPVNQTAGNWTKYSFDLVAAVAAAGISFTSDFRIKFQQYDNTSFSGNDGRVWDDIAITAPGDGADHYSLTLAAGESLSLALKKQAGAETLQLALLNAAGNVVASGAAGGSTDAAVHGFVAPSAGTYYVSVSGTGVVPYTLSAVRNAAFDSGSNASLATAQDIGSLRTIVGHAGTESDYYTVRLDYATAITPATSLPGDGPNEFVNTLAPGIELFDAAGNSLGADAGGAADGRNALLTRIVAAGDYKIRVFAASGSGEYVLRLSEAPASASPTVTGLVDAAVNEDGSATIHFTVADVDTPAAQFVVSAASGDATLLPQSGLTLTDLGGGNYRLVAAPAADRFGTAPITVSVSDGSRPLFFTFNLAVTPVNDPPSFTKGADQTSRTGAAATVVGWATDIGQGPFESGQTLSFQVAVDNPALFAVAPAIAADGTLTYMGAGLLGAATITVTLKDDAGGAETSEPQTFTINLTAAPTISAVADQSIAEDGTLTVDFSVADLDTPLGSLVVGATSGDQALLPDAGLTVDHLGGGNYRLVAQPAADRFGTTTISLTASDGFGVPTVGTFALEVRPVNDVPTFNYLTGTRVSDRLAGAVTLANFATSINIGPFEAGQTPSFEVWNDNPSLFTVGPAVSPAGTLTYTMSGVLGTANVSFRLHDDGGTAEGGIDVSTVRTFQIQIVAGGEAGSLDTTFSDDGYTTMPSVLGSMDQGRDVARQADGKLVVVSYSNSGISTTTSYSTVSRYNIDGTLDMTFGTGGRYSFSTAFRANSVEVLADGKILVAGDGSGVQIVVARLTTSGELDVSFGTGGVRTFSIPGTSFAIPSIPSFGMATTSDGRIVVARQVRISNVVHIAVVRFTDTGNLDASFNGAGHQTVLLGGTSDLANDVAFQADGGILVVGGTNTGPSGSNDFFVIRLTSAGVLDTAFNGSGIVKVNVGTTSTSGDTAYRVAVQPVDQKIIVSGIASSDFAVIRLNPDGTLDATFDVDGKATTNINGIDTAYGLALQSDGKIVLAGGSSGAMELARYTSTGALDNSFGLAGKQMYFVTGVGNQQINAALVNDDGSLVGVGFGTVENNGADLVVARWNSAGALDTSFNGTGFASWNFNIGSARTTATKILPDGRILSAGILTDSFISTASGRLAVWMMQSDGTPDSSFGTGGAYVGPVGVISMVAGLGVQSDGKVLVVDSIQRRLTRLLADGTLDTTFGVNGFVFLSSLFSAVAGLQVGADDSLWILGNKLNSTTGFTEYALLRLTSEGVVDTTFDGDGIATYDVGTGIDVPQAMTIQPDGKWILAGYSVESSNEEFSVIRVNVDGSLDPSFGGTGKMIVPVTTSNDRVRSLVVQADGKIVLAGIAASNACLVRLTSDGALDATFGSGGIVTANWAATSEELNAIFQQVDGKLLAVGWGTNGAQTDAVVARYNIDGTADESFGIGGKATTSLGTTLTQAYSAALQADGKLVVVGHTRVGTRNDAVLLRYRTTGTANDGPSIAQLGTQAVDENGTSSPIEIELSHASLPLETLALSAAGDGLIVPTSGLALVDLGGGRRQLTITPAPNMSGDARITLTASDGTLSYVSTFTVHVNALPIVDLNGAEAGVDFATEYVEDAPPRSIVAPTLTLDDLDGGSLDSATVTIVNLLDGDAELLAVDVGDSGLAASYASGVLSIAGTASHDAYAQVLRTVAYRNTSQKPDATTRRIEFVVNDGAAVSRVAVSAVAVRQVNDAPTAGVNTGRTLAEGATIVIDGTHLRTDDMDDDASQRVYTLTALTAHGALKLDGATLSIGGTFTQADLDTGKVTYTQDSTENVVDAFQFTVGDGEDSLLEATFALTITPVNDAPTAGVNTGRTVAEGATAVIDGTHLRTDDADHDAAVRVYTLTAPASHGVLKLDGMALAVGGTFSQADLDSGKVTYTHDSSENFADAFQFTVSDGQYALPEATFNLTITPVNDALTPALNTGLTLDEGATVVIGGTQLRTDDVDNATAQRIYTLTALTAHGALRLDGEMLALGDTFTQADLDTGKVTYTHDSTENFVDAFRFTVSDGEFTLPEGTFDLTIAPVNDAPVVAPQSFILYAKATAGTIIGAVQSTDAESGQTRTYEMLGGNGAIVINAATGVLTVVDSKLLVGPSLSFTVRVTDDGVSPLAAEAPITVLLRSANSPPQFLLQDNAGGVVSAGGRTGQVSIDESTSSAPVVAGFPVATLTAADIDEPGTPFPLQMTDSSGTFAYDAATGRITVVNPAKLDFEKTKKFTLTFKTTDHGLVGLPKPLASTFSLTVNLVDRNDAPTMNATSTMKIRENNAANTSLGNVAAGDADKLPANKTPTFGIVSQTDAAGNPVGIFSVDPVKGTLKVVAAGATNYEAQPFYTVVVQATDKAGLFARQTVTVQVIDLNEPPTLSLLDAARNPTTSLTLPENAPPGTPVGYVRVTNPDVARNETLKITASDSLGSVLVVGPVDPSTGLAAVSVTTVAKNAAKLNFEAIKLGQFTLNVTVADSGFLSSDGSRQGGTTVKASYVVQLQDVNEAPDVLTFQATKLPAGSLPIPAFTSFGTFRAADPDRTPQTYSYYLPPEASQNALFQIDAATGVLTSATPLTRKSTFTILVRVVDQNGLALDKQWILKT